MNFFKKKPVPVLDTFPVPTHRVPLDATQTNFFSTLLNDMGGTAIAGKDREEAIQKLAHQYDRFAGDQIFGALSPDDLSKLMELQKARVPQQQIDRFLAEHIPNLPEIMKNSFVNFHTAMVAKAKK